MRTPGVRRRMIRLLNDPPLSGPQNMARDEVLLYEVCAGSAPATMRLYQWDAATISLGYFQSFADYRAQAAPLCELPVVRRLTGGGAILHDLELTYSLALPAGDPLLGSGANHLYALVHNAIIAALAEFDVQAAPCGVSDDSTPTRGPFFCFARRHCFDVIVGGDKIAGSAQRRTRHGTLQHGSLILGDRYSQPLRYRWPLEFGESAARLRVVLPERFAECAGRAVATGAWTTQELAQVESLESKYAGADWTQRT